MFKCHFCDSKFENEKILRAHIENRKCQDKFPMRKRKRIQYDEEEEEKDDVECMFCGQTLSVDLLSSHDCLNDPSKQYKSDDSNQIERIKCPNCIVAFASKVDIFLKKTYFLLTN